MKCFLVALLGLTTFTQSLAQKHNLYGDVGTSPGFSLTYSNKLVKHFGVGIGIQANSFRAGTNSFDKSIPAIFADVRYYIRPSKKNQFFPFLDLGINIYKQSKEYQRNLTSVYNVSHNNGFYSGVGLGYFRSISRRGFGPYASLKLMLNSYNINSYSVISEDQNQSDLFVNGNVALSIGFKL